MTNDPRTMIRSFIVGRFPQADLAYDEDIFALGFVNSLFATELVIFIEGTFGITIPNEELTLDNFRTIDAMADLVARQRPKDATADGASDGAPDGPDDAVADAVTTSPNGVRSA